MPTYTLIMDYCGGTYISQVTARSPKKAMVKAIQNLEVSEIQGLGEKTKKILWQAIADEEPTSIRGVENVWCSMTGTGKKRALMNLIETHVGTS